MSTLSTTNLKNPSSGSNNIVLGADGATTLGTTKVTAITDSAGSNSSTPAAIANGTAKAWVNFNGTSTVAIRASYNVSSITDNGTGLYTLNFTTAMPDANYIVTGSTVGNATNEGQFVTGSNNSSSQSTSSAQFAVMYCTNGSRNDVGQVNVAVFR